MVQTDITAPGDAIEYYTTDPQTPCMQHNLAVMSPPEGYRTVLTSHHHQTHSIYFIPPHTQTKPLTQARKLGTVSAHSLTSYSHSLTHSTTKDLLLHHSRVTPHAEKERGD